MVAIAGLQADRRLCPARHLVLEPDVSCTEDLHAARCARRIEGGGTGVIGLSSHYQCNVAGCRSSRLFLTGPDAYYRQPMSKLTGRGARRSRITRHASGTRRKAAGQPSRALVRSQRSSSLGSKAGRVDVSSLVPAVPYLAAETLHQLVRHCGLDVCAEIIAAASPAQLTSVLDLDLWRSAQPGHGERFDPDRFGEWVELLVDAGDAVAAQVVARMDEAVVVAGLSRYLRVLDPAALSTTVDGEAIETSLATHDGPQCEVGGYLIRGITADAWDAIVALLLALEGGHPGCFHRVMRECRRLSDSAPEIDGLDELLMDRDQVLHDLAVNRDGRRSQQGYSAPAEAGAFLQMARRHRAPGAEGSVNALAAAYFRAVLDDSGSENKTAPNLTPPALPSPAWYPAPPKHSRRLQTCLVSGPNRRSLARCWWTAPTPTVHTFRSFAGSWPASVIVTSRCTTRGARSLRSSPIRWSPDARSSRGPSRQRKDRQQRPRSATWVSRTGAVPPRPR